MRHKKAVNFIPQENQKIGNKYLLKRYIDSGTFGTVWEALHLESHSTVALKIPKNQERGDTTLSEGKDIQGLEHPHVIMLNWMGRVDGVFVIEMEYFEGHKLSEELTEEGFSTPRTFEQVFGIFEKVLDGVEFIHSHKICHGDIKPQNILVNHDEVKITDFGTSKFIENLFIETVDGEGTWAYMAPEIIGSRKRYLNSDIYSLGVILYQLLTGRTPHQTSLQIINNTHYPKPSEINDNIPKIVEDVVLKALERRPKKRYQTISTFLQDLKESVSAWSHQPIGTVSSFTKEDTDNWLDTARKLYKNNEFEKAELLLKQESTTGKTTQDLVYHFAYCYYKQRKYQSALEKLHEINFRNVEDIRRESFEDSVLDLKGKILLELKRYDECEQVYRTLVKKNLSSIDYQYKYACVLALNLKEDRAIQLLEEINSHTPGILSVVKKLGFAYDQKKKYSEARGYFNYAITLGATDPEIVKRLDVYKIYISIK